MSKRPDVAAQVVKLGMQRPVTLGDVTNRNPKANRFAGKKILLTGASTGIGEAAAYKLGKLGAELILVARTADTLNAVRDQIIADGGTAHTVIADLADESDVARVIETVLADHGVPDVVINNAGRSIRRDVLDATERLHDYHRTMAINYFGPVQLTLGFLPAMKEAGRGHFINVSTWGVPGGSMPKFSAYAGSKAAITAFGRSIGVELRGTGIDVTTVYFPLIRTPMIAPTAEYKNLPALSPGTAAQWLVHAVDDRPLEIMPRYTKLLQRIGAASTGWADSLTGRSAI